MKNLTKLTCLLLVSSTGLRAQTNADESSIRKNMNLPNIVFIENKGQYADDKGKPFENIFYVASCQGFAVSIHDNGLSYSLTKKLNDAENVVTEKKESFADNDSKFEVAHVDIELVGATIQKSNIIAEDVAEEYYNYYLPSCPNGITNVNAYKKITIKSVYPGIDWVIYSTGEVGFKYDFIVHPQADASQIHLVYHGAKSITKKQDEEKLVISTQVGDLQEGTLMCYEENSGYKISAAYELKNNDVHFNLGKYNHDETLVIDPAMAWATYFGGSGVQDGPMDVHTDATGYWYVSGYTNSPSGSFPLYNPGGGTYYDATMGGAGDGFIARFDNWGIRRWVTYYGGEMGENIEGITANASNIFVTGTTNSFAFPTTAGCQQPANGGTTNPFDAFFLKFNLSGVIQYATYLGGTGNDKGHEICVDNAGNAYLIGESDGIFPMVAPSYQAVNLGGKDMFIACIRATNTVLWSTMLGGNNDDYGKAITTDNTNLYFIGTTASTNLITIAPFQAAYAGGAADALIAKFTIAGTPTWITYFGNSGDETGNGIDIDPGAPGWLFIAGTATVFGAPYNIHNIQSVIGGTKDFFFSRITSGGGVGMITWSTIYGGNGAEAFGPYDKGNCLCMGKNGFYLVGQTYSSNFPTVAYGASCAYNQPNPDANADGVIIYIDRKSTTAVNIIWSTYYGTLATDWLNSATVFNDQLVVCGEFNSPFANGVSPNPNYRIMDPGLGAYFQYFNTADDGIIAKFTNCAQANAGPDINACCLPNTFVIGPNPTPCLTYSWLDSFGNTHTGTPWVVTITSPRTYTLTVTSADGFCTTITDVLVVTNSNTCCNPRYAAPSASTYTVFPNPGSGSFNISCDGRLEGNTTLTIYDVTGRIVLKQDYPEFGTEQTVNLENVSPGIYYFEMEINGNTIVRKVIKV